MLSATTTHEAWNWQCWKVSKDKREWVGFFESEKDAFVWVKTQAGQYVINNVPPAGRAMTGRKVSDTVVTTISHEPSTARRSGRPVKAAVKVAPKRALTPEEIVLRDDAARIFAEHKAAEAAELESGSDG